MKRAGIATVFVLCAILAIGGWFGVVSTPPPPDPLKILFSGEDLTFEQAIQLSEELDKIADELEAIAPPMDRDGTENLFAWEVEIVPYFEYEGVSQAGKIPPVTWKYFGSGEPNFHTLGRCHVGYDPSVSLNIRHANPYSRWYHRSYLATLVHELAHAQGVYSHADPLSEPTTQLVTLEVLASMTRDRNAWALPALVRELESYVDNYAMSLAFKEDKYEAYVIHIWRVADSMFEVASFERSMDHWQGNMDRLKYILEAYSERPFRLVMEGLSAPAFTVKYLGPLPNECDCLAVNDLAFVVRHLRALARDYPALLAGYGLDLPPEQ